MSAYLYKGRGIGQIVSARVVSCRAVSCSLSALPSVVCGTFDNFPSSPACEPRIQA